MSIRIVCTMFLAAALASTAVAQTPAAAPAEGAAPAPPAAPEAPPTAEQILDRIDQNLVSESRTAKMTMTVEGKRRTRTYRIESYGRGETDSAMEYLSPARDKGTKMLKLGDEMWLFLRSVDRVQKLSGHMLREGMMGSDISYEDVMNAEDLRSAYTATIEGSEVVDGRETWKLVLVAHDDTVAYPKRVSWIDKALYIPLKQELFALSGMKLKTWTMSDIKPFDGRMYPTKMTVEDHLKKGSKTTVTFEELKFGVQFPGEVFSRRWLERR